MTDFDRLFTELTTLAQRLYALPDGWLEERVKLSTRMEEIRAEIASLTPASPEGLKEEIGRLERAIREIDRMKINVISSAGGSPGGDFGFTKDAMDMNRAIDENHGRNELMARLEVAKAKLAELTSTD